MPEKYSNNCNHVGMDFLRMRRYIKCGETYYDVLPQYAGPCEENKRDLVKVETMQKRKVT
jgi:hypothetical protein